MIMGVASVVVVSGFKVAAPDPELAVPSIVVTLSVEIARLLSTPPTCDAAVVVGGNGKVVDVLPAAVVMAADESSVVSGTRLFAAVCVGLVERTPPVAAMSEATGVALSLGDDSAGIELPAADVLAEADEAIGSTVDEMSVDSAVVLGDVMMDVALAAVGMFEEEIIVVDRSSELERTVVEGVMSDGEVAALKGDEELTIASNVEDPDTIVVILGIANETNDGLSTEGIDCDDVSEAEACLFKLALEVVVDSIVLLVIPMARLV